MVFENLGQHLGGYSQGMLQAAIAGREQALKEKNMQLQAPLQIAQTLSQGLGQWAQIDQGQQELKIAESRAASGNMLDAANASRIREETLTHVMGRDTMLRLQELEASERGSMLGLKARELLQAIGQAADKHPEQLRMLKGEADNLFLAGDQMRQNMAFDKRTENLRIKAIELGNDHTVAKIDEVFAGIADTEVGIEIKDSQLDFLEATQNARINAEYLKNDAALKQLDALDASLAHQKVITEKDRWEVDYLRQTLGARVLAEKEGLKQLRVRTQLLEAEHGRSGLVTKELRQKIKLLGQQVELAEYMSHEKYRDYLDATTFYEGGEDFYNPDTKLKAQGAARQGKLMADLKAISGFAAKHEGPIAPNDMFEWMAKNLSPEFLAFMTTTAGKRTTSSKEPGQYWEDMASEDLALALKTVSVKENIIDGLTGSQTDERDAILNSMAAIVQKRENIAAMSVFVGTYSVDELRKIYSLVSMHPDIELPPAAIVVSGPPQGVTAGGGGGLKSIWDLAVQSAGLDPDKVGAGLLPTGTMTPEQILADQLGGGLFDNQYKGPPFNQ